MARFVFHIFMILTSLRFLFVSKKWWCFYLHGTYSRSKYKTVNFLWWWFFNIYGCALSWLNINSIMANLTNFFKNLCWRKVKFGKHLNTKCLITKNLTKARKGKLCCLKHRITYLQQCSKNTLNSRSKSKSGVEKPAWMIH